MTPAPWNISPVRTTEDTAMIVGGEGFEFGLIADVTEDDDAAFIVKAVNSHGPMVKALTDALCELSHCADQLGAKENNSVRRAIAEARRILNAVGDVHNPK